jgi:hypothetical protein
MGGPIRLKGNERQVMLSRHTTMANQSVMPPGGNSHNTTRDQFLRPNHSFCNEK